MNSIKNKALFLLSIIILLLMTSILFPTIHGWNLKSDLMSMLPESEIDSGFGKARRKHRSIFYNSLVFAFVSKNENLPSSIAHKFLINLENSSFFSDVNLEIDFNRKIEFAKRLFPYRQQLLTKKQREDVKNKNFEKYINNSLQKMYSPIETPLNIKSDPFDFYADYLHQNKSKINIQGKYLVGKYKGQSSVMLFAHLKDDLMNLTAQMEAIKFVEDLVESFKNQYDVDIKRLGRPFYMNAGIQQARSEIATVGFGSILGIIFLFLFLFKRVKPLFISLGVITLSISIAAGLTRILYGSLHVFTLVIGAGVVGLVIDYLFHHFSQQFSKQPSFKNIRKPFDILFSKYAYWFFLFYSGWTSNFKSTGCVCSFRTWNCHF